MEEQIGRLIKAAIKAEQERRVEARHPFVYPISIHRPNEVPDFAFSRDLSLKGIGIIHSRAWEPGAIAELEIHADPEALCLKSEVRWSREYGGGWHLIGWRFLSISTLQIAAQTQG